MKTRTMNLMAMVIFMLVSLSMNAQNSYESAVKTLLTELDSAKTNQDYNLLASKFERISMAEPTHWEASYFVSFCKVLLSYREEDGNKKDALLDQAETNVQILKKKFPAESEIFALHGMIHQARMSVSASRGWKYSQMAAEELQEALNKSPENPRALYLMGMNLYHTPSMFGGGKEAAVPYFEKSEKAFENQKSNTINPKWGKTGNANMLKKCSE